MELIKTKSFALAVCTRGNKDSGKLALVLPGRLDTKDYAHIQSHIEYLANRGYFALSFDPPGTWESPGGIELYTVTNYLKAINELIEYLGNKPTILMGHSRGGSAAMLAGISNSRVTHIIAAMSSALPSGFKSGEIKNGFYVTYRDLPNASGKEKKEFRLPLSYFEDAAQYDIVSGLARCQKPKMFILGKKDTILKPESAKKAYEASAEPKQLHEIDSGHDYRYDENAIEQVNEIMGKFLDITT